MAKSTLDPETRLLYGESLQAPPGYRFDAGVATTFSMDFETALAVPVSLALFAAENRDELLSHPIALLEGAERIANRLAVYADAGQIHAGHGPHARLCSLLERVVVEVGAPGGGSFHPKLWALRFRALEGEAPDRMRLLILSRNLTRDRSWDAAVLLDGERGRRPIADNRPLFDLVSTLPDMAVNGIHATQRALTLEIAEDLRHARWSPPENCDRIAFAVNGTASRRWRPERCKRIGVISPFCDADGLELLAGLADEPAVLISRPDQLACVDPNTLDAFDHVAVLDELAEREDGEEAKTEELQGLHAKIFVQETGWRTRLTIGSGNATRPALITTANVEVFATLEGLRSRLGGVDTILGEQGFGRLTRRFQRGELAPPDTAELSAAHALLAARRSLARGALRLRCEAADDDAEGHWRLWVIPPENGVALDQLGRVRMWSITRGEGHHRDALDALRAGTPLDLGSMALIDITRFVAIELQERETGRTELFSTGLPIDGMPEERDGAILRWVIGSRDAFFRYLRLLLTALGDPFGAALAAQGAGAGGGWRAGSDDIPLLEELVRSHCAGDGRLDAVERLIKRLEAGASGTSGVPDEFLSLWHVFRAALAGDAHAR